MIITYRYRLLPSKHQHRALEAILESQRVLYNAALEERIDAYRKAGVRRTLIDQTKSLTEWRRDDPEAAALPLNLQRFTLKRLDQTYNAFFRRTRAGQKTSFPRYRGPGWFKSFGFREMPGLTLANSRVRFKGVPGGLRVHMHRSLPSGQPRSCVFKRDTKGWTISFVMRMEPAALRKPRKAVGVDLGITTFAALSDGGFIPSLRAARRAERKLRIAQRALARKRRGSRGRAIAQLAVVRCHASIARQRANHLHQASARLVREYDAIAVEDLDVGAMANGRLGRDVRDAGWSKFIAMLRYKAERAGVRLSQVDPKGTSQECSGCGAPVKMALNDRLHNCPRCGLLMDRDLNAACNILRRAGLGPGSQNVAGWQHACERKPLDCASAVPDRVAHNRDTT